MRERRRCGNPSGRAESVRMPRAAVYYESARSLEGEADQRALTSTALDACAWILRQRRMYVSENFTLLSNGVP